MIGYDSEHVRLDAISKSVSIFPPAWCARFDGRLILFQALGPFCETVLICLLQEATYLLDLSWSIYQSIHLFLGGGEVYVAVSWITWTLWSESGVHHRQETGWSEGIYIPGTWNIHLYIYIYKHIDGCFSWMIPSDLYLESGCLNKHIHLKLIV